jgi:uncharacterized protein (DUF362 family)
MTRNDKKLVEHYRHCTVAVHSGESLYLDQPPFNPHSPYPEFIFQDEMSLKPNPAYEAVRNCFKLLALDAKNFGTPQWNPLHDIITPGQKVVIKPNFVISMHPDGGNLFSIITHPSIIRPIVDYTYKALKGEGEIIIADAPQMDCNFAELLQKTNLQSIQETYWRNRKFEIKISDLREFWLDKRIGDMGAFVRRRKRLPGDQLGSAIINLERKSEFYGIKNFHKFYGADYNRNETLSHHCGLIQEYILSRTILSADVLISVPKLKVHKKVGVTLNAKGLVGTTTNKNCIVHYTLGTSDQGGDQFPPNVLTPKEMLIIKIQRLLYDILLSKKKPILDDIFSGIVKVYRFLTPAIGSIQNDKLMLDAGNWRGNDTAWRMVADLMKVIVYADRDGILKETPQRKVFCVVDGLVGGEKNGPLSPDEKHAGVVICGFNPLAVDIVGSRIMGFNWQKLKYLTTLLNNKDFNFYVDSVSEIRIFSNIPKFASMFDTNDKLLAFIPHPGWQGYLELI